MALTPEEELEEAISRWLDARGRFDGGNGIGALNEYWDADRRLLTAFADGWRDKREEILSAAFRNFRRLLVHTHERPAVGWRQSDMLT